jgi:hypothetical protein
MEETEIILRRETFIYLIPDAGAIKLTEACRGKKSVSFIECLRSFYQTFVVKPNGHRMSSGFADGHLKFGAARLVINRKALAVFRSLRRQLGKRFS